MHHRLRPSKIPLSFTFKAYKSVQQAVKALESGKDFTWEQRTAIRCFHIDIHKVMKTVPVDLFIPAISGLATNIAECQGTGGSLFRAFQLGHVVANTIFGWNKSIICPLSVSRTNQQYFQQHFHLTSYIWCKVCDRGSRPEHHQARWEINDVHQGRHTSEKDSRSCEISI